MPVRLTEGAISLISTGELQATDSTKPVLQVRDIRPIPNRPASAPTERYRLLLSDGLFCQGAVLSPRLNDLVRSHQLHKGSVVQLTDFVVRTINNRLLVAIFDLLVFLPNCDIIGDPKQFSGSFGGEPSTFRSPEPMQSINQLPQQQFHFCPIAEIENLSNNTIVDIIGVVYSISPSSSIMRRNNTETLKRTLSLKDMSGRSVEVTLCGDFCNKEGQTLQNMCDSGEFPVLAIKAARVREFNGKNVGTISTSLLCIEPDFPKARELKTWYDTVGRNTPSVSLSHDTMARTYVRKTISQIKDENLGTNEKADCITVRATLSVLKMRNFYYTACPIMVGDRNCGRKVTKNSDGTWQCDRCNQTIDECDYKYILQMLLRDHTGQAWATAFQEGGEDVMGMSAKDLCVIKYEERNREKFAEIVRNALRTEYNFKLMVKEESFNDERLMKIVVVKAEKIQVPSDTSFLSDLFKKDLEIAIPIATSSAPLDSFDGSVVTAGGVGQQAGLPASQTGQYVNQYGGYVHGVSCNNCGCVVHSSMNCPSTVNPSGGYVAA